MSLLLRLGVAELTLLIAVPVVFVLTMAFVWAVDRALWTDTDIELAERDLWDRLAVGPCEWLP